MAGQRWAVRLSTKSSMKFIRLAIGGNLRRIRFRTIFLGLVGETKVPELPRREMLQLDECMVANDQRIA